MQDSERDRLTVEVCEAVSAISPAGSHLATTAARLRELVVKEVPAGDYMKEAERLLDEICRCKLAEGAHDADGNLKEAQLCEDEANKLYFTLLAHIQRGAVPMPAEVPMPEPVAYGFGNTAITGHTNRLMMVRLDVPLDDQYAGAFWLPLVLADEAHTYGVACRAAGEAAGYARGLAEAGDRIRRGRKILDAALRGEVKP